MHAEHRVLSVLAHPDDESFLCAGTMARFAGEGAAVCVVSATRGEAGEIADGVEANRENLGEVREQELRNAMQELGVDDVRFLGYRDSGMAGTADNAHPKALAQATTEEVASRIAAVINEFRPTILITFGPEGVYLHPDHVSIHHASMAAIARAHEDPGAHRPLIMMLVSMERELFLGAFREPGAMFEKVPYETLKHMGTPRDEITHRIDVSDWLSQKRAALARHRSQFGDKEAFVELPLELAETVLRTELFRQQLLPWEQAPAPFPLGGRVDAGSHQAEIR
jgi:LmbE family N-acetylglucosaminyl deacetylase